MEHQLTIYNTLDRKKELFVPLHAPHVGMYVCGPTVYGDAHLGHARPAITFDVLFRYLTHSGYKVRYVRNITDVGHLEHDADDGEDKISKKARLEQLEPMEVAHYYTERYHRAMDELNVLSPSIEPCASGHIIEQIEFVKKILAARHPGKVFTIPSNGHFDTTEGNIKQMGSIPRNLYHKELLYQVPEGGKYEKNPFKGNMDIEKLEQLITAVGPENVPLVFTCITNNPICGQPVSMGNIREINRVAHKYNIPLIFDVARWAENCYFIKMNEEGYADKSIAEIATEMFSYCDGFCMSAKKDGHANMGGMVAFRDKGLFWQNFSDFNEDGTVTMRETLELGLTIDERLADGYYYSKSVRLLEYLLTHPEELEKPMSEEVQYE